MSVSHNENIFQAVFPVDAPLSSWVQCPCCSLRNTITGFHRERQTPRGALPPREPAVPRFPPQRGGSTHFGTDVASLGVVASFPRTSSMMCSSGAAGTGSSGGTSVMISATCSVHREGDPRHGRAGDRTPPAETARPGHRSRAGLTWFAKGRETSDTVDPAYLSVYRESQNGIHNSKLGYKLGCFLKTT